MTESYVKSDKGGISFVGPDATALYRAMMLRSGIKMYAETGMKPNRSWKPTLMLQIAGQITGKVYKRGQYQQAQADLTVWIETMKSALPVVTEG